MELENQFIQITTLIAAAKDRAYHAVNRELVALYWSVGEYVSEQVTANFGENLWCMSWQNLSRQRSPMLKVFPHRISGA